jgi:hypothetical protein
MRHLFALIVLILSSTLAFADDGIAGAWRADMGHNVFIAMDILADGHWTSETVQGNKVVAQLAGTYEQTKTNGFSGKLVFTPVESQSTTTAEHGAPKVEEDTYSLKGRRALLELTTGGETMDFHRQNK